MQTFYTDEIPGRTLRIDQNEYLWCSGTAYLGLSKNPVFISRVQEGLQRTGLTWGSSRNNTLRLTIYEAVETALSEWTGAATALTLSSGMLAGQTVVKWVEARHPQIPVFHAPNAHPAIRTNLYSPAMEQYDEWFSYLPGRIANTSAKTVLVVTDSVGSPHTAAIPFDWIHQLPVDTQVILLVDDSHGLGIFGERGAGIFSRIPVSSSVQTIVVSSLNKALSIPAGVILGPSEVINSIRTFSVFSGSSPANPAFLWALFHSFDLVSEAHQQLMESIQWFDQELGDTRAIFHAIANYPAYTTTEAGLHDYLLSEGILTACFPYPGPDDPAITRIVINALHTKEDLTKLAGACRRYEQLIH